MALKISAKCNKHPRYNPEKDGEAGIHGGCIHCLDLLSLYNEYLHIVHVLWKNENVQV